MDNYDFDVYQWKTKCVVGFTALLFAVTLLKKKYLIRKRHPLGRPWTRSFNKEENRAKHSWYFTILKEAALSDSYTFQNFTRMSPICFEKLLKEIGGHHEMQRKHTKMRTCITAGERLALTLRYFATGDNLHTLAYGFRVASSTACLITRSTAIAIYEEFASKYLAVPNADKWRRVVQEYYTKWNYPNCCGAIDGKHIAIICPPHSGSLYQNYKGFKSIVLMAIAGANYEVLMFDLGEYGRQSDSGIWCSSDLRKAFKNRQLDLPAPSALPLSQEGSLVHPMILVGDDAFELTDYMMKGYPGRRTLLPQHETIYNYRHSRARRTSENLFGILATRWRLFLTAVNAKPENVEHYTRAVLVLHNLLIAECNTYVRKVTSDYFDRNGGLFDGD
ncbi:protein ALP1-like [Daphnia magna]|uniref:protein ALP1-like n=1 Tax=Daphnia magna TaxID=35525 RepID=UPI001E1BBEF8|nr:protein ALP1-like [Daphnia magna]